jgi:hypothetical protein
MDAGTLHRAIAAVCPVTRATVVKKDDRATWSYEAKPEATQEQKNAADNVVATIDVNYKAPAPPAPGELALYDHESRILALEGAPAVSMEAFLAKTRKMK